MVQVKRDVRNGFTSQTKIIQLNLVKSLTSNYTPEDKLIFTGNVDNIYMFINQDFKTQKLNVVCDVL